MDLTIVSLSQDVSFEDGSITNFLLLRLPSGHVIRAVVMEDAAKLLVENLASQKMGVPMEAPTPRAQPGVYEPPAPAMPSAPQRTMMTDAGEARVFGGDGDPEEEEEPSGPWMPGGVDRGPEVSAPAQQTWTNPDEQLRAYKQQQKEQAARIKMGGTFNGKHIPKDDMGYPRVAGGSGADPGEVMGSGAGGAVDEDGVGAY